MALRVWLPLNGNLENKGLSKLIKTSTSTPTFLDEGKMGKCLSLTPRVSFTGMSEMKNFTILFWLKVDSCSADWADSLSFTTHKADGTDGTVFRFEATKTSRACSFHNNGNYSITGGSRILITSSQFGEWHHCGFSYDGEHCYTYIDGVLTYTDTGLGGTIYNYFHIGETDHMVGGMNDLRIYDECLSSKQIKEISKGLICHYKLEGIGINENLILRSDKIISGGQASGITRTYMKDGSMKIVSTSGNGNWCSLGFAENSNTNVGNKLKVGDIYTISCDIKVEEGSVFPTLFINNGNGYRRLGGANLQLNVWQRVYYTNTWNNPGTGYGNISLHLGFSEAFGTYYFKNFKLEKGNFTPWIPAPTDYLYLALGYNNIIAKDVSGNKYDGTVGGTLSYNANSPRYSGSTLFDGSTSYIAIGRPMPTDELTVNVWAYMDNWVNYNARLASCTEGGGWNFEPMSGAMNFALGVGTSSNVYMTNFTSSQTPLSGLTSGWHMFTGTFDGIYKRIYIDGILKGETNSLQNGTTLTTATPIFYNRNNGIFIGAEAGGSATTPVGNYFNGSMSDFRIYATALSADEILTMYKNSGIIDKKGKVYAYEFKEE